MVRSGDLCGAGQCQRDDGEPAQVPTVGARRMNAGDEQQFAVRLADLLVLDRFQVRNKRSDGRTTDPATVARYMQLLRSGGEFKEPITVAFIKARKLDAREKGKHAKT